MSVKQQMEEAFSYTEERHLKLKDAVGDISQAQADFKPSTEEWSIGEVLHHLSLSGGGLLTLVRGLCDGTAKIPPLVGKDGSDKFLAGVADVNITGKAPAQPNAIPTHGQPIGELMGALDGLLSSAEEDLTQYRDTDLSQTKSPFATFCDLDVYQWVKFCGAHEARHLPQIDRIKTSPGYPAA